MKILKSDELKKRNRHINEDLRTRTIEMNMDIYLDLLQRAFNEIPDSRKSDAAIELFPFLLNDISENGLLPEHTNPNYVVDNYTFNGDFISRKDKEGDTPWSDDEWQTYCEENTSFYNDDYALISF